MLTRDYIVGLVDGEGSFTVYIRNPNLKQLPRRRTKAEPRFYLKLKESDKAILFELKKFFGCGNIYFQRDKRPNHRNCYRYEVSGRKDLETVIIPFFRKNSPRICSKQKDFKIFCDLMDEIKAGRHLTREGLTTMYRKKQEMH